MQEFKIFDAFAGIGGIRIGFEKYGYTTIIANDMDRYCKKVYDTNFGSTKMLLKNINELDIDGIPNFDIFTAGFPCQAWSIAGKQKGFDDERGQVIYTFLKIIKKRKPLIVFFENVKNFKTVHKGEPYKYLCSKLEKYGYKIKDKIMNTCKYTNIPQNRERIFIVGFRDNEYFDNFEFPEPIDDLKTINQFLIDDVDDKYFYTKKSVIYNKLKESVTNYDTSYQYRRYYVRENKNNLIACLTANMGSGGHNVPIVFTNDGIRKLTPRECFNLQGFPSTYVLPHDVSDCQLYKQIGNSVTVPLIEMIARNISIAICKSHISNTEGICLVKKQIFINGKKYNSEIFEYDDIKYCALLKNWYNYFVLMNHQLNNIGSTRKYNIHEAFSEGLYCLLTNSVRINKILSQKISSSFDCYNFDYDKSVQIKCTQIENDCTSFGPMTEYDLIVFVDLFEMPIFKIYEIEPTLLGNIILNKKKNETFSDQQKKGKRPRLSIKKTLIELKKIKPIFVGNINKLDEYYKILLDS